MTWILIEYKNIQNIWIKIIQARSSIIKNMQAKPLQFWINEMYCSQAPPQQPINIFHPTFHLILGVSMNIQVGQGHMKSGTPYLPSVQNKLKDWERFFGHRQNQSNL